MERSKCQKCTVKKLLKEPCNCNDCKNCKISKLIKDSENQSCNCDWFPTHTFVDDYDLQNNEALSIKILKDSIHDSENSIKNSQNSIKSSENSIRNSENSIINNKSCIKYLELNSDAHSANSADTEPLSEKLDTNYTEYKF